MIDDQVIRCIKQGMTYESYMAKYDPLNTVRDVISHQVWLHIYGKFTERLPANARIINAQ